MNKTNLIVFIGIVVLGGFLSFFFLNRNAEKEPVGITQVETEEVAPEPNPAEPDPQAPSEPEQPKPEANKPGGSNPSSIESAESAEAGKVVALDSPDKVMSQLTGAIASKSYDRFVESLQPDAVATSIAPEVKALIESEKLALRKEKPFSEISKSADSLRWAFNFVPDTTDAAQAEVSATTRELYADIKKLDSGEYGVSRISFPIAAVPSKSSKMTQSQAPAAGNGSEPVEAATSEEKADSLTVAHAFSRAVVARDFKTARALSDPASVTDERVAALMIAIEEGKFALREERPLVVTLSRDDITWVLTRVQSDSSASEFALELGQVENDWKVNGLTFSKVLSSLSEQAGGGEIAYSSIVEDPSGGDSLVLYFEFDEAALTPRATRQLAIVADILSQGDDRVMRINGHADALGSDDYNRKLSNGRADAIRDALISMGVKPSQVVTEAYGETQPRRPNFNADGTDNPSGRSQNRRAEVFLDF